MMVIHNLFTFHLYSINNWFFNRSENTNQNLNRVFYKVRSDNYKDESGQRQFFNVTQSGQNDTLNYQKGVTTVQYI